jgi:hypothetical protein
LQTLTRRTFDSVALQRRMRTVQQQWMTCPVRHAARCLSVLVHEVHRGGRSALRFQFQYRGAQEFFQGTR